MVCFIWFGVCMITAEVLEKALPKKYKRGINQELIDTITDTLNDPDLYETYRDNFLGYIDVLQDGRFKITDYLSAVKYCTHKLMGNSNIDSYIRTFPDRYNTLLAKGTSAKDISSHVAMYNKSILVNKIMEQSMIPTWIINQDLHQKAVNVLADLMMNAQSEKVRADSANSLLVHLKPPEVRKVELDVGLKKSDDIEQLRTITLELASQQRRLIEAGVITARDMAETKLIGQVIEHDNN